MQGGGKGSQDEGGLAFKQLQRALESKHPLPLLLLTQAKAAGTEWMVLEPDGWWWNQMKGAGTK